MTKLPKKMLNSLKRGTSYALDKRRRIAREKSLHVKRGMQNIAARQEMLTATVAYNARLETDRV